MLYAFIDTNIFVRLMSQGKLGCEPELFRRLRLLTANGVLTLLVPEVVCRELEGQMQSLPAVLEQKFGRLNEGIDRTRVWNEIEDAKQSVLKQLDSLRDEKLNRRLRLYDEISAFLRSTTVSSIPFLRRRSCVEPESGSCGEACHGSPRSQTKTRQ